MKKILITGGNGYIAQSILKNLSGKYDITSITRKDFDLTNREATDKWFQTNSYDVVIHTAVKGGNRLTREYDGSDIFYQNIKMYYNLLYNRHRYGRLIHFGSGAELGNPSDPYGLSKKIIHELSKPEVGVFNIRIFAVFNKDELDRRFIKANIKNYINKKPLIVHQNKLMDFFYMDDLISVIEKYIEENISLLSKVTECSYKTHYTLIEIADIINKLSNYKVPVEVFDTSLGLPYTGKKYPDNSINLIGVKEGIKQMYLDLKHE
tara:strand:+ start:2159 stop:2950 length:792 start_codon:yes stop_codon:yes gene_type:complete